MIGGRLPRGYFRADDLLGGDFGSLCVTAADGTVYRTVREGVPPQSGTVDAACAGYLSGGIIVGHPDVPVRT